MPDPETPTHLTLLWFCAGTLVAVLILLMQALNRLSRVERLLRVKSAKVEASPPATEKKIAMPSASGAFAAFLSADPRQLELSKGEQFKNYRKWRKEQGMNWSTSDPEIGTGGV